MTTKPPITVSEYAALHGVPLSTVRWWCANGALSAVKTSAGWMIILADQEPPALKRGRKPKAAEEE